MRISKARLDYAATSMKLFIREHKLAILAGIVCFITGTVTGIVVSQGFGEDFYKTNFLWELQNGTYSYPKFFFLSALLAASGFAVIILCGFHRYCNVLAFAVMFYTGYRLGVCIIGCLCPSAISGAICIILYYIPMYVTVFTAYLYTLCRISSARCGHRGIFTSRSIFCSLLRRLSVCAFICLVVIMAVTIAVPLICKILLM